MRDPVETIRHSETTYAIIVRAEYDRCGVHFFSPSEFSQQLGYMRHPTGQVIEPHVHNAVTREVLITKEVLFIRKGRLRVDFYTEQSQYLESRILRAGDVILLSQGGHGFQVLEEVEMFEVKQGPYTGDQDKTRITGVDETRVVIRDSERDA